MKGKVRVLYTIQFIVSWKSYVFLEIKEQNYKNLFSHCPRD
jgi:hypothetical protein